VTHVALTALVNGAVAAAIMTIIAGLILRITSDTWNATTREAVWWALLVVSIIMPVVCCC